MEEYKNYVCVKESNSEEYKILFVDFKDSEEDGVSVINPCVFVKEGVLTRTSKSEIKDLLVTEIMKLSNMNNISDELKIKFTLKNCDESNYKYKIQNGSNYIAADGRIGRATNILVSEENYNKYNLKDICEEMKLTTLFDSRVNDVYLYRYNSIEQPGLLLVYYQNRYELITTGFYPEKFFLKITL